MKFLQKYCEFTGQKIGDIMDDPALSTVQAILQNWTDLTITDKELGEKYGIKEWRRARPFGG